MEQNSTTNPTPEAVNPEDDDFVFRDPNPDEEYFEDEISLLTHKAERDFKVIKQRMQENPQLGLLALTHMEPHLENFRQHLDLLTTPGFERALLPNNWNVGSSDIEVTAVAPRVMLRRAMFHITSALTSQAMSLSDARHKGDAERLRNIYMAMATARWADEVLNNKARKGGSKPGLQTPKPTAGKRGGARPGAGRPRKKLVPLFDETEEDQEANEA